jgi:polysaccharide pyruvyl transferase WcaK-like protein
MGEADARSPHATKRRIVLFGLFGIGNLGNDSTLWVVLHQLRQRHPDAELLCVTDDIPDFAKSYGLRVLPLDPTPLKTFRRVPLPALRKFMMAFTAVLSEPRRRRCAAKLIAGSSDFFVVGTGSLDDFGAPPWEMPAWIARWCAAARSAGATVKLLAVGAGPNVHPASRWLMRTAVKAAEQRAYRDTYSRAYMAGLGVSSCDDRVVPDIVFAWPAEWLPEQREPQSPPRVVGVGLMAYFGWHGENQETYRIYIAKMVDVVGHLLSDGYMVRLLVGEPKADARAVLDVLNGLGQSAFRDAAGKLIAAKIDSIQSLLDEIMLTDFVVATRFHNVVLALATGRPVLSFGYAAKFDTLMQTFGLSDFTQHVENIDVPRFKEQFRVAMQRHAELTRSVVAQSSAYRTEVETYFDDVFGDTRAHKACPGSAETRGQHSASSFD